MFIQIKIATKTHGPDYSAMKLNNSLEINISFHTHFSALGCVNDTLTFVFVR